MKIPFFALACGAQEHEYVKQVLDSGWLTTASRAKEFEDRFAEFVGGKYALAVNSCTAALHLALDAIGVQENERVFVPTMTFTATAEVVRYLRADPVFLDVDYGTRNITPQILLEGIKNNPDVKTLMLVHFGGHAADLTEGEGGGILAICERHGIQIVHDAAHAFPARQGTQMIGSFPGVTCFSFYANKTITTGEGGMLVTDDESVYRRAKLMRLHGIDRDIWDRFTSEKPSWEYDVVAPGFKYNLPDLAAAVGLAQLEKAADFRQQRQRCADLYMDRLSGLPMIDLPERTVPTADHAWHLFPIVLNEQATLTRAELGDELASAGIGFSVHYKPLHRMTYYRERYQLAAEAFPNAERIWAGTISLPIYPSLSSEAVEHVCSQLHKILTKSGSRPSIAA